MNIVQLRRRDGTRTVASVEGLRLRLVAGTATTYQLARDAAREGRGLEAAIEARLGSEHEMYDAVHEERRLLTPLDHPDPAHMLVTGTGLTHLGSASARDSMHKLEPETLTDSMRMFQLGLEGGRPDPGEIGVQPEWFFKGTGDSVVAPEAALTMPDFALDGGEEPELAGLYLVGPDGTPLRLGFALANEFSDHVMERQNYLYLAHSKIRASSFGPELRLGAAPTHIEGVSRIRRRGEVLWEKPFLTGEANMSHSLANLEHHHFKYPSFRRPGDAHAHYFGTATLSTTDGIRTEPGDVFEIEAPGFGRPLRNPLAATVAEGIIAVRGL